MIARAIACVLLMSWISAFADDSPLNCESDWSLSNTRFRRSALVTDDVSKAGSVSYTDTGYGNNSSAVDIAAVKPFYQCDWGGKGAKHSSVEMSAFLETHRNTLSNKRQDTSFIGLNIPFQFGTPVIEAKNGGKRKSLVTLPRMSAVYSTDKLADIRSILAQADITWLHGSYGLNQQQHFGSMSFMWSPIFGIEHQRTLDTASNIDNGSINRMYAFLDITAYPVALFNQLSVTLTGKGWRESNGSGPYKVGNHSRHFSGLSFDYDLVPKNKIALSISREIGENPTEGLPRSVVTKLALKIKLN